MGIRAETLIERYGPPFGKLAFLLPRAYDTTAVPVSVPELPRFPDKTKVMLRGTLSNFRVKQSGRLCFVYADLYEGSVKQICQWPTSPSAAHAKMHALQCEAGTQRVQLVASVTSFTGREGERVIFVTNGKIAPLSAEADLSLFAMPVYELRQGTKPHEIKRAVTQALVESTGGDAMPDLIAARLGLPPLMESLKAVHGLAPVPEADIAAFAEMNTPWHRRITAELIWRTLRTIRGGKREGRCASLAYNPEAMRKLESTLPYTLTMDQKGALRDIFSVFASGDFKRMLLLADVGAGKTTVMVFAAYAVLQAGKSVAVLAPSSVLAQQLFEEFAALLEPMGHPVLFAAKMTKAQKTKLQKKLSEGEPCVVVGTTTVNGFDFPDLGLVCCDEEQKIGTEQKSALLQRNTGELPYQILSTATPIPRSLASTIYGSVQLVKMQNRPAGRLPIFTKVVGDETSAHHLFSLIRKEASLGRQALCVCPSISSGEMASVEEAESLCSTFLPGMHESIHGQMKAKKVDERVARFKRGEFPVLIATSLVDSGFDVKNLSVVVVFSPDRFGLSMLHQIRGRVGRRAGLQGYCALYPTNFTLKTKAAERLDYFCKTHDGFALAQKDLQLRGSGELAGTKQSGGEIDFVAHAELVEQIEQEIEAAGLVERAA